MFIYLAHIFILTTLSLRAKSMKKKFSKETDIYDRRLFEEWYFLNLYIQVFFVASTAIIFFLVGASLPFSGFILAADVLFFPFVAYKIWKEQLWKHKTIEINETK